MKYSNETLHEVLHCPMDPKTNDARASTVGEFLAVLLSTLWEENEMFSGKRPLGNSDWQWQVYTTLVKNGLVPGTIYINKNCRHDEEILCGCNDTYEELEDFSYEVEQAADELIIQAIKFTYNHEN